MSESTTPTPVVAFDTVAAEIQMRANVSLADLPKTFSGNGMLDLPSADKGSITIQLPYGKSAERTLNIQDTNPNFYFCWLDVDDAKRPEWAGYKPVKKTDGLDIPARHYSADGTVVRGELRLYVAHKEYAKDHKQHYRSLVNARLNAYSNKATLAKTSDDAGELGRVVQEKLGSKLLNEGDPKGKSNSKER